jgi:hypothetical protein
VVRGLDTDQADTVREFGSRLFDSVFTSDVRLALATSLSETDSGDLGLRVRLRLNDCPELADLPWEYLYDKSARRFLALSEWTPIVRYLDLPGQIRPLTVDGPLRVLGMISSPSDYPALSVDDEWAKLQTALSGLVEAGRVHLTVVPDGTLASLNRALRRDDFHVFHYIGHGGFLPDSDDGVLVLEDDHGRSLQVSGLDIGVSLHDHRTLRLAVLNSCEGARAGITDPYSGTAQALVQQGIPAVVAMQFEITDDAAVVFSHALYEAIADGYPLDASMAEARKAVRNQPNATEWGTPVLYLRAPDGRIFDMSEQDVRSAAAGASTAPLEESPPEAEAQAMREAPERGASSEASGATRATRPGGAADEPKADAPGADEPPERRRPWGWMAAGAAAVLLVAAAVGVVVLKAGGGDDNPADRTDSSASQGGVLAAAEAPYFSASECGAATADNAPFAMGLPTTEVVKCVSDSVPFTGTFWCAGSQQDFLRSRSLVLGEAEGKVVDIPSTVSAAGENGMTDGVQKSFHHRDSLGARVYWDSPTARCGAELQSESSDVSAAVAFWSQGVS